MKYAGVINLNKEDIIRVGWKNIMVLMMELKSVWILKKKMDIGCFTRQKEKRKKTLTSKSRKK